MMPQRRRRLTPFAAALLLCGVAACQSGETTDAPAAADNAAQNAADDNAPPAFRPADDSAPAEAEAPAAEPAANHTIETSVVRNDDGSISLVTEVTAANGYHLNTDPNFPWRVKVADDAPVAAGTTLGSADATRLEEHHATFTIPVAAPGDAEGATGEVVAGICDDQGCVRVREEVAWVATQQ